MAHHSVIYLPKKHDYAELTRVWEASVRATHDFLPENYITLLRNLLETQYLDAVNLFCTRDSHLNITGFGGTTPGKLEMLFIAPDYRGMGAGQETAELRDRELPGDRTGCERTEPASLGVLRKTGVRNSGQVRGGRAWQAVSDVTDAVNGSKMNL
jgi:putative acetyltransferase